MKKYVHVQGQRIPNVTTIGTIQIKWQNDNLLPKQYHCVCTGCRTGSDRSEEEVFRGCPTCIAEKLEREDNIAKADAERLAVFAQRKAEKAAQRAAIDARRAARIARKSNA